MPRILQTLLKHHWLRRTLMGLVGGFLLFLALDAIFPLPPPLPYSPLVLAADSSVLHAFLSRDDKWRLYTEQTEVTPTLRQALLFKEDRWFYYHPGVNPLAVGRAMFRNLTSGRRTSGASTLTMQVARLLEPKARTYGGKLREMARALQLEWHFSKDEILQLYLNLAPYGSNIEGLKSAAMLYFQKSPRLLSLAEVTTLAVVPNHPNRLRLGQNNPAVRAERDRWLRRFAEAGLFEKQTIADALREPLSVRRHEAPRLAPHLSRRLVAEFPGEPILRSTLRPVTQARAEALVRNAVQRLRLRGIHNAAVLVLNNQTRTVEAYVGSADFNDPTDGGQVDGITAVRSPGSALKPLLYATAYDRGLLTPQTILPDVPVSYHGYAPENFDRQFHGPVTAHFALANSLNVPAVRILKEVGTPVFIEQLKKAGFESVKKAGPKLGLSLILGGCGVTLEELTNLFSAFARGGKWAQARFSNPSPAVILSLRRIFRGGKQINRKPAAKGSSQVQVDSGLGTLFSPEAAYLVTRTLSQITRPDLPDHYEYTYRLPKIAWKTGTSFGKRDAWSIGYNARYTVGVWVGNFSGQGVPELSGAAIATPLLFDVFNAVDYNAPARGFGVPKGLAMRKVCAVSGLLPAEFCEHQILDYQLPGVSRTAVCEHLRPVFVNTAGTVSYCTRCRPDSGAMRLFYPNLAPDLLAWYDTKRVPYQKIPPHNPACTRLFDQAESGPVIVDPADGSEFFVNKTGTQQLALRCQTPNGVRTVFWYVNDRLLRRADPGETVFFRPPQGRVKISCTDDQGRSRDVWVVVRWQ
ncbi:MAG: penicillin-binding protein 1C [Sphingobacteriaceae bacterium]|nr:penicillin-binding protein 1C [Cytophagaceae bacterium]